MFSRNQPVETVKELVPVEGMTFVFGVAQDVCVLQNGKYAETHGSFEETGPVFTRLDLTINGCDLIPSEPVRLTSMGYDSFYYAKYNGKIVTYHKCNLAEGRVMEIAKDKPFFETLNA